MHRNGHTREQSTIETQQLDSSGWFCIRIWSVPANLAFAMLNFHYNNKSGLAIRIVFGNHKTFGSSFVLAVLDLRLSGLSLCCCDYHRCLFFGTLFQLIATGAGEVRSSQLLA